VASSHDQRLVDAASVGTARQVASLLRKGAAPSASGKGGSTAVYAAALREDPAVLRVLLEAGADPNQESTGDGEGTPLCAAASWGRSAAVRELLDHGANPNQRESGLGGSAGYSPLLWASRGGHPVTVRMLLEAGADPNADAEGDMPLCFAVEHGSVAVVRLLLEHGADPRVVNSAGRTPLEIAEGWIATDVEAELRRRAGAEEGQDVRCTHTPRPGDADAIVIEVGAIGSAWAEYEHQTGDRAIAELLRSQLDG
jgi:ankyrin repeat protein